MSDERTPEEIVSNYPPRKSSMVRTCTKPIIGAPNEWLFDEVVAELLACLNAPGLTRESLFSTFRDTAGAFVAPSLHNQGKGRFFRGPNAEAATRLAVAHPQTWLDVLRIPDVGPDMFYDMFTMMAVRWAHRFGECVPVFIAADGTPLDGVDITIYPGPGISAQLNVGVRLGIGFDPATGGVFAFPTVGEYVIGTTTASIRVNVPVATPFTRVGIGSPAQITVFHDADIVALSVHLARANYLARHHQGGIVTYDKHGNVCGSCEKFAFVKQEDLESQAVLVVDTVPESDRTVLQGLTPGRYVIAGHSADGIIITTVRDVAMDYASLREIGMDHGFDLSRLDVEPPSKAFLQGDIVQQSQQDTRWCGLYSLAHTFSYWAPVRYNPMGKNGQWAGEHIKDDWTSTWLHTLVSLVSLGVVPVVASVFIDDPSPGTLLETVTLGARFYGFSSQGYSYKSVGKDEALKHLKRWIHAGVPVIVAVDEGGPWYDFTEHFKVLVGYDDHAHYRYTDDDGIEHIADGALYFLNSGLQGETREDFESVDAERREKHLDYGEVPIGNDADSYTVFLKKWEAGDIPTFSKSFWCLPVFPVDFVKAFAPDPDA